MKHYICYLKAAPVFPYIGLFDARSKTAAARLFLSSIEGMRKARKSVRSVQVDEVTAKYAQNCHTIKDTP